MLGGSTGRPTMPHHPPPPDSLAGVDAWSEGSVRPRPWPVRLGRVLMQWRPDKHPLWLRLTVALVLTLLAAWLRMALAPAESGGRFITLSLAAAVSALYGGFRAGMFSTVVGMLVINYALVKPYFSLAFDDPVEAFWLNLWHLITQLVVVGAIALMQRQNRALRRATELARRTGQRLNDTFEVSAVGMAHSHIDGRWIRVNRTYCQLIGYTEAELLQTRFEDFTHPDDLATDLELLQRALRGEIAHYSIEKRYIHRLGHVVWVQLTVALVRQPDGAPDYLIAVVQDISHIKSVEQALRTTERLLSQAQVLAGMASWQADMRTRRFLTLSGSHVVLDLPAAELAAEELRAITHPDDLPMVDRTWAAAVKGLLPYNIEYRLRIRDEYRWFSVRAEFERDASGRALRALGVTLDITGRKQAELEIRQLNATLEERIRERTQALQAAYDELESYSYAVAHDLRSPLRIINGFASAVVEDESGLSPSGRQHLDRIMLASKKMGELIDGLLKLSQVSRGELVRQPVNLSDMAQRLLCELSATEPGRQVHWEVEPGLQALADPPLVEAVLQNLLHNAWKYSARTPQARIRVTLDSLDGVRAFCVADNGAGFDMGRAAKLFQPFQRLHGPHEFVGLGIGLATVRRIVVRHGGLLKADSAPGQGAKFWFTLQPPLER